MPSEWERSRYPWRRYMLMRWIDYKNTMLPKTPQCSKDCWTPQCVGYPPPQPQFKANSDGAIFQDTGTAGIGVVIRDSEGMVIAALSERISLPSTVEDVEALACRKAISFAIEIGLQDVIFEVDSEIIYRHLVSESICMTAFGHIIEDSRRLITSLRKVSFSHVRRNGNRVADKLAKLAKYLYEPQVWIEDIHRDVTDYVTLDRSFILS